MKSMENLVILSVEEFLSLYNGANRGADYEECCNALQKLYGRSFMSWSITQAMVQFADYINKKKPELRAIVDQLNQSVYVPNSSNDPTFKTSVETYVKKAKMLMNSTTVAVDKLTYNSDINLSRNDVVTSV